MFVNTAGSLKYWLYLPHFLPDEYEAMPANMAECRDVSQIKGAPKSPLDKIVKYI